jgi:hypothetical protein
VHRDQVGRVHARLRQVTGIGPTCVRGEGSVHAGDEAEPGRRGAVLELRRRLEQGDPRSDENSDITTPRDLPDEGRLERPLQGLWDELDREAVQPRRVEPDVPCVQHAFAAHRCIAAVNVQDVHGRVGHRPERVARRGACERGGVPRAHDGDLHGRLFAGWGVGRPRA